MAATEFEVDIGFSIEGEVSIIKGTVDPSAGGGVPAPIGSLFCRTTNGDTYRKFAGTDTDWVLITDANDVSLEDGYQNTFMGKSGIGSETPTYSSTNVVSDTDSLETAIGDLDAEIGAAVTPETRTYNPTSDQAVNLNIDQLDSAIGTDAQHASTNYSTVNASLKTNISELDAAIADIVFKKTDTNVDADPAIIADSVAVATYCMAEWHICVKSTGTPANRESLKITAVNDGTITNIDYNRYAKNKVGAAIAGLTVTVTGASGDMNLVLFATENIDYTLTRIRG